MSTPRYLTVLSIFVCPSDYRLAAAIYIHVSRPLCWLGLLDERRSGRGLKTQVLFSKSPLWPVSFSLETDRSLRAGPNTALMAAIGARKARPPSDLLQK